MFGRTNSVFQTLRIWQVFTLSYFKKIMLWFKWYYSECPKISVPFADDGVYCSQPLCHFYVEEVGEDLLMARKGSTSHPQGIKPAMIIPICQWWAQRWASGLFWLKRCKEKFAAKSHTIQNKKNKPSQEEAFCLLRHFLECGHDALVCYNHLGTSMRVKSNIFKMTKQNARKSWFLGSLLLVEPIPAILAYQLLTA